MVAKIYFPDTGSNGDLKFYLTSIVLIEATKKVSTLREPQGPTDLFEYRTRIND